MGIVLGLGCVGWLGVFCVWVGFMLLLAVVFMLFVFGVI